MPLFRREVEGSFEIKHLDAGPDYVSFGRGIESGGSVRRHGWIAINRGNATLAERYWVTGLPSGSYTYLAASYMPGGSVALCSSGVGSVTIDSNGHALFSLPPYSAVVLHTGKASLEHVGIPWWSFSLILIFLYAVVLLSSMWAFMSMWERTGVEVRTKALVAKTEHQRLSLPEQLPTRPPHCGVLMACLEHWVPPLNLKIVAGGLGNVAQLYVERLPVDGKFVFAMLSGPDYSAFKRADFDVILEDTK
eukprot:1390220-Prymnesium_polylepis.1